MHSNPYEAVLLTAQRTYALTSNERAEVILRMLRRFTNLSQRSVLDVGCGPGRIAEHLRRHVKDVIGLDTNEVYLKEATERHLQAVLADVACLPLRAEAFDVIICNDVLEHVPDSKLAVQEIMRVISGDGIAFIQCANKYQIVEPHFLLPFLSWVPHRLANVYLRLSRRGKSYDAYYPLSTSELDAMCQQYVCVDLSREYLANKITGLKIGSPTLRFLVSAMRKVLSDQMLARLLVPFSVHVRVLLKKL
jgi:ubiquinone/menaquinone biosynthesis C-methylase UbiE